MRKLPRDRWLVCAIAALTLAIAAPSRAADVDPATLSAARALAEEGLALYDKGQFAAALDKLDRADALIHAPTTGLYAARCLENLGRLVDASERYLQVSRLQLEPSAKDVFKTAVVDAGKAYEALKARIPKLAIGVRGAPDKEIQVSMDGKALPAALVGVNRPTDPGTHAIEGKWGERVVKRTVVLKEGATEEVILDFTGAAGPAQPGSPLRTVGWVAAGTGVAGLVLGGVTYGVGLSMRSDLVASGCSQSLECPDTAAIRDKVDAYRTVGGIAAPAFIAGGVLAAGGVVLILTAPSTQPSKAGSAALRPWISPWGAGVTGVF